MTQLYRPLLAILCLFSLGLPGCIKSTQPITVRENSAELSQAYATFRAEQIANIHYHISADIRHRDFFTNTVAIDFDLIAHEDSPITLDFEQGNIQSIQINNKEAQWQFDKWFIQLAPHYFTKGRNTIVISYQRPYSTDGQGLHQYQDQSTHNYYLYTQFEPYAANRFIPAFDQPNLKAKFSMDVLAPNTWQVISATRETDTEDQGADARLWHFPISKLIPSYIFSLHAGPFASWTDTSGDIPLRLFAREEIAQWVDPQEWFDATHASFDHLQNYFQFPYPFEKYDQIIVPDFNYGAMENVAAVTYSERFTSRSPKTDQEAFQLAMVIAHEMAHMWFGNIVTMNWWNDLWLNESFATYTSYETVSHNPKFTDAWNYFSGLKNWAYYEDQLATTHPIDVPVPDTGIVHSLLDGISYAKGASVLNQLSHFVTPEAFQPAMAHYIAQYQYQNAQLQDLVNSIAQDTNTNLDTWVKQWLLAPGLNSLSTHFQCRNNQLVRLTLKQSAPMEWPTLRSQRVQLGLFYSQDKSMALGQLMPVTYKGASTKISLPKENPIACPEFIFPNYDDWGYLKIRFDQQAIDLLNDKLNQFDDTRLRLIIWQSMWSLAHDAEVPFSQYVSFFSKNIRGESNPAIINSALNYAQIAFNAIEAMDVPDKSKRLQQQVEDIFWREYVASPPGSNRQKVVFKSAINVSFSPARLDYLANLLAGKVELEDIEFTQEYRWSAIRQLNRYAYSNAKDLLAKEQQSDTSEMGRRSALAADAIQPEETIKKKWLENILADESEFKFADLTTAMHNLFPGTQQKMRWPFAQHIVDRLKHLSHVKDGMFIGASGASLLSANCTQDSLKLLSRQLQSTPDMNETLRKKFKITHQNDARCIRQKQLLEEASF